MFINTSITSLAIQRQTGLNKECSYTNRSEIVVPIIKDGNVVGVIDIDCQSKHGFDAIDKTYLEELSSLLSKGCDW